MAEVKKHPATRVRERVAGKVRVCPVPGCFNLCAVGNLLCRNHWAEVPRTLQSTIWDELAKSQRNRTGFTPLYRSAARQAILIASGQVRSPMKED